MNSKRWKVTLTPISPIHIGDGDILDPTDYIAKDKHVYYLNQVPFVKYLLEKGNTELKKALESAELNKITRILADNFDENIKSHWNSRTSVSAAFCKGWREDLDKTKNSQQLHAFIRNRANGLPYIPGSSIKGAIRTAILNYQTKDRQKMDRIKQKKADAQTAEAILLTDKESMNMADDPFKDLHVSDAHIDQESLFIDSILRYGMSNTELPVYYEMLKPESHSFTFTIKAKRNMLKIIKTPNLQLQVFSTKLFKKERKWIVNNDQQRFKNFGLRLLDYLNEANKTSDQSLIRIGFGSGQWSMSFEQYWKDSIKTKAIWQDQMLGWAFLKFKEIE